MTNDNPIQSAPVGGSAGNPLPEPDGDKWLCVRVGPWTRQPPLTTEGRFPRVDERST
jgi:hypothetical protein